MAIFMEPAHAAGLLLPLYIVADCYAIYLFRRAFSVRNLKILIPSGLVGVVIGYLSVSHVPGNAIKALVAGVGIFYIANALRARLRKSTVASKPADVPRGVFWGILMGITSYIAHSGGPPYQVYVLPQKLEKMTYLGTTTILFAVVNLMKVPPYIMTGQMSWSSAAQSLWLAPMALFGAWCGARAVSWLPERVFYALIEIALGLVSCKLLFEAFGLRP
jgi:uncharacterized membrane protein YfcA